MAHHCCDPCRATQCRAYSAAANSRSFQDVAGMSRCIPHATPKNSCRTYLATPLSLCCGEICLQNRIALDGGVAATPTPIALHCFTKVRNFPDLLLRVFADSLLPVYGKGSPCFLGVFPSFPTNLEFAWEERSFFFSVVLLASCRS